MDTLESQVLEKLWFYPFQLPSGAVTRTTHEGTLNAIHETRLGMMRQALAAHFPQGLAQRSAVDLACHQGFFSAQLASQGCRPVHAVDARPSHVDDCRLIAQALGLDAVQPLCADVHDARVPALGTHDVVLCFGLIYHLENPVGALRVARQLTRPGGICLVETQVVPNMGGPVDWGAHYFVKPLEGVFGIIDETYETHGSEASTTGICLAPSVEGLLFVLRKLGFAQVSLVPPPEGAYEQHRFGKRVMVRAVA